jgi:hypothetical protein
MRRKFTPKVRELYSIKMHGYQMPVEWWATKTPGIIVTDRPDGSGFAVTHYQSGTRIWPAYVRTKAQASRLANILGQLSIDWGLPMDQLFEKFDPMELKDIVRVASEMAEVENAD